MANKTVISDAEFKTYVEGCAPSTMGTVYMNDDSKYWTFNKQASGKINAMCIQGDDIEVWIYDGTDWNTNRIPFVVDNLTSLSTVDALSANQGKALDAKIEEVKNISDNNYCKMPDGTLICWGYVIKTVNSSEWTSWGYAYYNQVDPNLTWAVPFVSSPYVIATNYSGDTYVVSINGTTTKCNKFYAMRPHLDTVTIGFNIVAIGRWK